jgi:hypothetical protein
VLQNILACGRLELNNGLHKTWIKPASDAQAPPNDFKRHITPPLAVSRTKSNGEKPQ